MVHRRARPATAFASPAEQDYRLDELVDSIESVG
jgi:hypothetical protein